MRILHVIGWVDFADGGPPMIATHLAAAQAGLGHDVSIAFYSAAADRRTDEQLAGLPHWNRVAVHRFPRCTRRERLLGTDAARRLRPLIDAADVVHLHNVWEGLLIQAAAIARAADKPYFILLNGMLSQWSLRKGYLKKRLAVKFTHARMLNGAAALQLGNEEEGQSIRSLGITAPAIAIPNGVTLEEIDPLPARGEFIAAHPALTGRRFILFLGRLHPQKGLDFLADAFAMIASRHPTVDLVIAGPDGGAKEDFQQRIVAANLSRRVHVVGPLYGREKFAALVDCDCFALPSRHEGFSVAVLEAMAAKTPVIISRACHFPHVANAKAGEVIELSAKNLAEAIDRVLSDPNRRAMGETGRALIESQYTWRSVAERTIAAYERALKVSGEEI
jgi:glycosyltransferase involved in cell wall biosynthesis